MKTTIEKYSNIICQMLETFQKKNTDYGNSVLRSYNEYGLVAIFVRIEDKVNRFHQLATSGEQHVKDESMIDTLLDCASYCFMALAYTNEENKEDTEYDRFKGVTDDSIAMMNSYLRGSAFFMGYEEMYNRYGLMPTAYNLDTYMACLRNALKAKLDHSENDIHMLAQEAIVTVILMLNKE